MATKKLEKFPVLVSQLASKLLDSTRSYCADPSPGAGPGAGPGTGANNEMNVNVLTNNLMGMNVSTRSDPGMVRISEEVPTSVIKDQHALTVSNPVHIRYQVPLLRTPANTPFSSIVYRVL